MTHIFTTAPDKLYEDSKINKAQKDFIQKKGWSLQTFDVASEVPDVNQLFMQAFDHYQNMEYYIFGEIIAEIAWVLQKPEENTFEVLEEEDQII